MAFQPDTNPIVWRLHLSSPPERVYDVIDSDAGRAAFWAESAVESDGTIDFRFIGGEVWSGRILRRSRPTRWSIEYFGSVARFDLGPDGAGGTDLTLIDEGVGHDERAEVAAGWLNVLLPLKAFADHGIDLRNHDPARTWAEGYVDQ